MVRLWVLFLPLTTIAQNLSQYNRCVIIWGDNVRRLLFRCLEVIDRLDAAYDFGGGSDVFNDFVYAFISHRRLHQVYQERRRWKRCLPYPFGILP